MSSPTSIISGSLVGGEVDPISLLNTAKATTTTDATAAKTKQALWTILPASQKSLRTTNPIRALVDPIVANIRTGKERGDGKDLISLALGDPTAAGNLPPCPVAIRAVQQALASKSHAAGYIPATGLETARHAIANFHSLPNHNLATISPHQVVIANGCSGALELALTALLDESSILLVPQPGFPLYQVIAESHGATVVHYNLLPDRNWECDFEQLHALMRQYGSAVRGMVVNNPSNPTGAVWTKQHLREIVRFCDQYALPLVADEVYGDLTFEDHVFVPAAHVAAECGNQVPVISASGLGKQFLIPGWRVGWVVFQDNVHGSLQQVEAGAKRLAQVILGASHLVQTAIPALLDPSNTKVQAWKCQLRTTLQEQMDYLCNRLAQTPGLQVFSPGGAMYAMVKIDTDILNVTNEMEFVTQLLQEENVFVLPGSCFGIPNVFRVVFCAPIPVLEEAANRICQFCLKKQRGRFHADA